MKAGYEKPEATIITLVDEDILNASNQTPFAPYGNEVDENS